MIQAGDEAEIQRRMEGIRQSLVDDRAGIERAKSSLLNPGRIVANLPLATIGLAVALGYLLAPRLGRRIACQRECRTEWNGPVPGRTPAEKTPRAPVSAAGRSLATGLVVAAMGAIGRAAAGMAARKAAELLAPVPGNAGSHRPDRQPEKDSAGRSGSSRQSIPD